MIVTPATGAYGYAMANNYNGVPRAAGDLLRATATRARGRPARDLRGSDGRDVRRGLSRAAESDAAVFRIGLLGHGTVGAAFAQLLGERAERDRAAHRRAPGDRQAC